MTWHKAMHSTGQSKNNNKITYSLYNEYEKFTEK